MGRGVPTQLALQCSTPWPARWHLPRLQGFERVADVSGELARVRTRDPWDGSEGAEEAADEFDLADLMAEEVEAEKAEL